MVDPETDIERRLRARRGLVPAVTLATAGALLAALVGCVEIYRMGHPEIVVASGLLAHAVMIVLVHDGAHHAITRSAADRWLASLGAGLLLLPLYGEAFRRYHLIHHRHANSELDPLFSPSKAKLYREHRLLYMVLDLVPMLLSFVCKPTEVAGPEMRARYMLAGLAASGAVIAAVGPPVLFVAGTIVALYAWATVRDWCEHFGTEDRLANAYWFPLGMGIGNHDAHHRHPGYSWITMALGLHRRPKDTHPLRAAWLMASSPAFRHYEQEDPLAVDEP